MVHAESMHFKDEEYILETGKWAKQAGGAVTLKWGDLVLLATATAAPEAKEGMDFFPLTVEYREKFYASGQIPGSFFKREGRPTEKEILVSRVTDRPLRPLFPKNFFNEVQIFVTLLSSDGNQSGDVHAITAASAALMISNIPFAGPVAGVRVGRINGEFVLFPSNEELEFADLSLALAGTEDAVTMIEGHADEVSEEDMLDAIRFGHDHIKSICKLQKDLAAKAAKPKMEVPPYKENEELKKKIWDIGLEKMREANTSGDKKTRQANIDKVKEEILEALAPELEKEDEKEAAKLQKEAKEFVDLLEVEVVRDQIFNEGKRADGRTLEEIRPIEIEVGVLPGVHGSCVFTRGETQSLGVVTLGSTEEAQKIDDVEGESMRYFFLHYNFLPFSVGEVRRYGGPGRREIGHGNLAEKSLEAVVPPQEKFPYSIRVVSEILESNGSSSMATVCSGSLAMMDAGVPIRKQVAGIAMGLITKGDQYAILTDIAGLEDHFGDMDFKVAGTDIGITGFQLDLKVQGISMEIMEKALKQARTARLEILSKMNSVLDKPRKELAATAPRIVTLQIDKEHIGELIGPSGKNIRALTEATDTSIAVEDNGLVKIYAKNKESAEQAALRIKGQFEDPEIGKTYDGIVTKITDFGAFIEIFPGKVGLCHISKIAAMRIHNVHDHLKVGQKVRVKVLAVDRQGRINLSIKDAD